jgi:DNA repair exonuclease SbcCD nuclease subunit
MRVLYTSDCHIGRTLYAKKQRYEDLETFLTWLTETIQQNEIDALRVTGDVFDTVLRAIAFISSVTETKQMAHRRSIYVQFSACC